MNVQLRVHCMLSRLVHVNSNYDCTDTTSIRITHVESTACHLRVIAFCDMTDPFETIGNSEWKLHHSNAD